MYKFRSLDNPVIRKPVRFSIALYRAITITITVIRAVVATVDRNDHARYSFGEWLERVAGRNDTARLSRKCTSFGHVIRPFDAPCHAIPTARACSPRRNPREIYYFAAIIIPLCDDVTSRREGGGERANDTASVFVVL